VTRGGRKKSDEPAVRRCISTGDTMPKAELIRFVVGPENRIVPDVAGNLPGRGIWVSADRAALTKAVAKKLFARAAKKSVEPPQELLQSVEDLLAKRVTSLMALARKSGGLITGFEKVKAAAEKGTVAILIQAADGSEGQTAKIRPPRGENTYISCLTAVELGVAFGRKNVIHAALAAGGLNQAIVEDAARLKKVRGN